VAASAVAVPAAASAAANADEARSRSRLVPFHGPHQAGIATPSQEHIQFATLDFESRSPRDLSALLQALSAAAARLTSGQPVGALQTGIAPPVDTGEAVGLGPARLTVTFGLGPRLFRRGRLGLSARRPAPLVTLPRFHGDALEAELCGGDIAIQACADDPQVAFHAVHDLIRLASPTAVPRWSLAGFGRTLNTRGPSTPRNLMGFKDGTANIMSQDAEALRRFVWAADPESPRWMHGGTYMVVRRIAMLLGNWDSIGLDQQEQTFGRHKLSGAPLGASHEHDRPNFGARTGGALTIPADAHIRLASPQLNHGQRILRRGYSYAAGIDRRGAAVAGGQLFICFQRDPRRQFIPIQRRLSRHDALGQHIQTVGSAIFACPPGTIHGGYVGAGLFS
jgi:deferrochelatase/peroxidase EfeB